MFYKVFQRLKNQVAFSADYLVTNAINEYISHFKITKSYHEQVNVLPSQNQALCSIPIQRMHCNSI